MDDFLLENLAPVAWIPLGSQFLGGLPLLFDPCIVFEIVDRLPVRVGEFLKVVGALMGNRAREVGDGGPLAVGSVLLAQLVQSGLVELQESVNTVKITSCSPSSKYFAVLIAARRLQTPEMPRSGSFPTCFLVIPSDSGRRGPPVH